MKNLKQWIILLTLGGLFILINLFFQNKREIEIDKFMGVAEGEILEIYRANLQSTVNYMYIVNEKKYYASDSTPGDLRSCIATKACICTKYKVEYSTKIRIILG